MTTIASPRPSISLSSRRTSVSTDTIPPSTRPAPGSASATGSLRRNRAALRDFYNLPPTTEAPSSTALSTTSTEEPFHPASELDAPDFNPTTYISSLLSTSDLEQILRVEASLVSEIRTLDGEKKALVYDNYSKLIAATDTIRAMREKMDPLVQTERMKGMLVPAVGHIAAEGEKLAGIIRGYEVRGGGGEEEGRRKEGQRETVRWVLGAEERLRGLVGEGRREDAEREWDHIRGLLDGWEGAKGVEGVRRACEEAMGQESKANG